MADVIEMLALSPTMEEGTLAEWLKEEGDQIEDGEVIAEVETDKATMEMESFFAGTVLKLLAEPGQTVKVGDALAIIGEAGEDISSLLDGLNGGGAAEAAATSPEEKRPEQLADAAGETAPTSTETSAPAAERADGARVKASPLARRMAEEKGLNLSAISGSGPGGRIIKRDVEAAKAAPAGAAAARPTAQLVGSDVSMVPGQNEPLSQMRKAIARRLVEVWQSTPHFYLTKELDMAAAMERRKEINAHLAEQGLKISVNDMIVKACAAALAAFPAMNSAFAGDQLYRFDEVNIGVAVAIDDGLITPTVRNADKKSLGTIAREIRELAGRARQKKLRPEEYSAHTFSISNLGMYAIDEFMAVINPPDAAIMACGSVQKVPVVEGDEIVIGTRMKVSLACDHRVVDGAVGAEFLLEFQKYIENPVLLLV